jgi:hypothetical protein
MGMVCVGGACAQASRGVVFGAIDTFGYHIQRMTVYVITLRASTDLRGLRLILKRLWRVYQLRCIDVREDDDRSRHSGSGFR